MDLHSLEYAIDLDKQDGLYNNRTRFIIPKHQDKDVIYLCGNSLGLQPNMTKYLIEQELNDWAQFGVEGHFQAKNPWFSYHHFFSESLARLVGAHKDEVVAANTLTVNLHLLMMSFYRPSAQRYKIIMEAGAFPSDQYAMYSQADIHGFDPQKAVIEIAPRTGEYTLRTEDILACIEEHQSELALVIFGGVNYYTGQVFDMKAITAKAHSVGALAGFDLAHAVGNVPLSLHDWDVDFACWCSYKYLNAGPGGVGGLFVHEKHGNNPQTPRLKGWWGTDEKERFKMEKTFVPMKGAASWQMSNAPVFNMIGLRASLDIYDHCDLNKLFQKGRALSAYLRTLLESLQQELAFTIITPKEDDARGCQLSLLFGVEGKNVFDYLTNHGVIADWREPNVIRVAPVPLYNTFEDCYRFYALLKDFIMSKA